MRRAHPVGGKLATDLKVGVVVALLAVTTVTWMGCKARGEEPVTQPDSAFVKRTDDEVNALIEAAKARARLRDHDVLLVFGASWCPDCLEVERLLGTDLVREALQSGLEVVVIDVGRKDRHPDLLRRFDVARIATLVVLSPDDEVKGWSTLEPITGGAAVTSESLSAWLRSPSVEGRPIREPAKTLDERPLGEQEPGQRDAPRVFPPEVE